MGVSDGPVAGAAMPPRPSASYAAAPAAQATLAPASGRHGNVDILQLRRYRYPRGHRPGPRRILHVNYTIDPAVNGTVTLTHRHPADPRPMLPTLQTCSPRTMPCWCRATGIYRVMPADQATPRSATLAASPSLGGAEVLPLRYASAQQLAAMLQPYVSKGGSITADPNSNALVIQGDPATREALTALVQAFDVDALAGQSYELFPVTNGDAQDFADAFSAALAKTATAMPKRSHGQVVPLERIGAVLVIARAQSYLSDATRIYGVLDQVQRETVRSLACVLPAQQPRQ